MSSSITVEAECIKFEKGLDTPLPLPYNPSPMTTTAAKKNTRAAGSQPPYEREPATVSEALHAAAGHNEAVQEELKETVRQLRLELIEWRMQANYRKTQHVRAVEREAVLKERVKELEAVVRALTDELKGYEELKAKHKLLEEMHFGRKTEQRQRDEPTQDPNQDIPHPPERPSRRRGQQPGQKGHGRRIREELPKEEVVHEMPKRDQRCPDCGKPFKEFPGTEDSEEIHVEVKVFRRVHKRKRCRPTCQCGAVPGIVTAPAPPKLIPKGLFSIGFWVWLILEKFLFQRPFNRVKQVLALQGCHVSPGTLTGGLKTIGTLVQPLYVKMLERSRTANRWHMDETRWLVFEDIEGKEGHRWWLWVVVTKETCCFILDPSRSSEVPKTHLGGSAHGTLNVDRYSAYKVLLVTKKGEIKLAFCWAHVRRDFLRVGKGYKKLRIWSEEWVERIEKLFRLNRKRCEVRGKRGRFAYRQRKLRKAIRQMAKQLEKELAQEDLHPAQEKVLTSLRNHWEGLTLFVDDPDIPMDNNEAERALRNAVVGRKNFYGNGAVWSGQVTAALYTILETLGRCGINPQRYLQVYFEACARNGGKPPDDIESFLPWSLSEEVQSQLERAPP
jgi:transposase